jgi:hypothetical protein
MKLSYKSEVNNIFPDPLDGPVTDNLSSFLFFFAKKKRLLENGNPRPFPTFKDPLAIFFVNTMSYINQFWDPNFLAHAEV